MYPRVAHGLLLLHATTRVKVCADLLPIGMWGLMVPGTERGFGFMGLPSPFFPLPAPVEVSEAEFPVLHVSAAGCRLREAPMASFLVMVGCCQ